jgi:tetratricopeptide (TPR) repeat protein
MRKASLSYNVLLADVYWMRALQHYGYYRLHHDAPQRYLLLYPLLDLTTTLDPNFVVAHRFGAIFLAEPDPGGAGRPDLAIKLLEKGVAATPEKWQYYHDIGFVYYWHLNDYKKAAEWFTRGGDVPGSPWWLRTYAAVMLTRGGDRQASRAMWHNLLQTADNDWVRNSAQLRLTQLDVLDQIDALALIRDEFTRRRGRLPESWVELIKTGLLGSVPTDPSGVPYTINFATGEINVSGYSKLYPLPTEPVLGQR